MNYRIEDIDIVSDDSRGEEFNDEPIFLYEENGSIERPILIDIRTDYMTQMRISININKRILPEIIDKFDYLRINKFILNRMRESDKICSICMEEFILKDDVLVIPECNHLYHEGCIRRWLTRSRKCPMDNLEIDYKDLL